MAVEKICGLLAVTAFLCVVLRPYRPELSLAIGLLAGVGVALLAVSQLSGAVDMVEQLLDRAGMSGDTALLLMKSLGICLLTQFTADVCRDAGETGLASHAEFAGKVAMLLLAMPLFWQILELAMLLMDGGGGS